MQRSIEWSRLTEKKVSGTWHVKGIAWKDLQEGATITKETGELLYGCLCKLKDYEDIGMSPDQLKSLWYQLKDAGKHICDVICKHPEKTESQEDLDEICASCPVGACISQMLKLDK